MKRSSGSPLGIYTVGIAALFLAGFLLMVILGAQTYRDAVAKQAENNGARALLSYLSTCVKGGDSAGQISVQDSGYGPVLTISDASGYALRIYQYQGQLLEEYLSANAALTPEKANVLGDTATFFVEKNANNTLRITTDAGDILLYLRSGEALG